MRNRNALNNFNILTDNVRGIKSKMNSLLDIVEAEKPALMGLSETKLKAGDLYQIDGYKIKRVDREKEGGGVLFAYKKEFENMVTVVMEEKEEVEMLWIKLNNGVVVVRFGIVYMPQEDAKTVKEQQKIFGLMKEQIEAAIRLNEIVVLMGDFNCKVGKTIPSNTDKVTKGGKILKKMLEKYNLCLVNSESICKGTWTRIEGEEKSILDYVITRKEDCGLFHDMLIDEEKNITPYTIEQDIDGKSRVVYSDHCMIRCKTQLKVTEDPTKLTKKVFDRKRYEEFANDLANQKVSSIIDTTDLTRTYSQWSNKVMEIQEKYCTVKKPKKKQGKCNRLLIKSKNNITRELKGKVEKEQLDTLKKRKTLIMEHLEHERMMENKRKVEVTINEVKEAGGVDSSTFWMVKKRLMGNTTNEIAAIIDEKGEKQENEDKIKEVYQLYFQKLLQTPLATSERERTREEEVEATMNSMEIISKLTKPRKSSNKEVEEVVNKLDTRKAKDSDNWSNEIIVEGGNEMVNSLVKIFNAVDESMCIPDEWKKMCIKTIDKKGSKLFMTNKRGLFLTNIISKVYERVIKERNSEGVEKERSQWQMGGVKKRSTTDNLFLMYSVIERNNYLKQPTYVFYADAEKCFDKLWLDDAVIELWRQGTNIRDAIMIKRMNEEAKIVVHTTVGDTDEIICRDIVRQGTVYGPPLCGVSMSRVNDIGRGIVTFYGPRLILQSTQFVDDINSAGSPRTINNTVYNCKKLEEMKKMTFNNDNGKTEYTIVNPTDSDSIITCEVKKGKIKRVKEHKSLGMWIDERGTYMVNIEKNSKKVSYMIETVKGIGSPRNLGKLALETRIKLVNAVIMPSMLYNVEVVPVVTDKEIKKLESIQQSILTRMLEVPGSTPYMGLLMETGMWTMEGRIEYKKLMLYHNIVHSGEDRIIKKILKVQENEVRKTTWYAEVTRIIEKYGIEKNVEKVLKSVWKKEVKERIGRKVEEEVRKRCRNMRKTRTVQEEPYAMKDYLKETSMTEATDILKTRLHMTRLPCNYGYKLTSCPLCGREGKQETEHYFSQCSATVHLAKIWAVEAVDMKGPLEHQKRAKNHLKKVEVLMETHMKQNVTQEKK